MSAVALQLDDASAARTDPAAPSLFREGRVIHARFFAAAKADHPEHTLYGPTPYEAAKAICDGLMLYPEEIEIRAFEDRPWALLYSRKTELEIGLVEAVPPSPRLAAGIAEALGKLEAERWRPIRDWRPMAPE